jgi:hypothetical protein
MMHVGVLLDPQAAMSPAKLDNTTLREEGSCGYSSAKTVRSIDRANLKKKRVLTDKDVKEHR